MSGAPLLDTHAWVWWVDRDRRLGESTIASLDGLPSDDRPYLADISLWEVATLVERGRLEFSLPLAAWLEAAAHPRSVRVVGITPDIAAETAALPGTSSRSCRQTHRRHLSGASCSLVNQRPGHHPLTAGLQVVCLTQRTSE